MGEMQEEMYRQVVARETGCLNKHGSSYPWKERSNGNLGHRKDDNVSRSCRRFKAVYTSNWKLIYLHTVKKGSVDV